MTSQFCEYQDTVFEALLAQPSSPDHSFISSESNDFAKIYQHRSASNYCHGREESRRDWQFRDESLYFAKFQEENEEVRFDFVEEFKKAKSFHEAQWQKIWQFFGSRGVAKKKQASSKEISGVRGSRWLKNVGAKKTKRI